MVEYVVTCYSGSKSSPDNVGFLPGCSLKLVSIGLSAEGAGNSLKINAARIKKEDRILVRFNISHRFVRSEEHTS